VVFLVWMAAEHPLLTAGLVIVLLVLAILLIRKLWRFARQLGERFRNRSKPQPTSTAIT
jgi:uncharacterized membrane protein YjgN (DUF898 family)